MYMQKSTDTCEAAVQRKWPNLVLYMQRPPKADSQRHTEGPEHVFTVGLRSGYESLGWPCIQMLVLVTIT